MAPDLIDPTELAQLRRSRGWSRAELAGKARVTRATIYNIEAQKHVPHEETLWRITNALRAADQEAAA